MKKHFFVFVARALPTEPSQIESKTSIKKFFLMVFLMILIFALPIHADLCVDGPSDGSQRWVCTADTAVDRGGATTTLLGDGTILLISGTSAEIYHPRDGGTLIEAAPEIARRNHTATRLGSGNILLIGGSTVDGQTNTSEIFDVRTRTWRRVGDLAHATTDHTATLLDDGRVLVVGGFEVPSTGGSGTKVDRSEIYDPSSETWVSTDSPELRRYGHTATRLPDGRVVVVGGQRLFQTNDFINHREVEVFDPGNNTWSFLEPTLEPRYGHTSTLLPGGRLLVIGGEPELTPGAFAEVELYDPTTQVWQPRAPMSTPRVLHHASLMADGRVWVVGGCARRICGLDTLESSEIYDPSTDSWQPGPETPPIEPRQFISLPNMGLFTAQSNISFNAGGLLLSLGQADSEIVGDLGGTFFNPGAFVIADDRPMILGGSPFFPWPQFFDASSHTWTQGPQMMVPTRANPASTLMPSGKVLVVGGDNSYNPTAQIYDPALESWSDPVLLPAGETISSQITLLLADGSVLRMALDLSGELRQGERLWIDGLEITFDPITPPPTGLSSSQVVNTLTLDGQVMLTGLGSYSKDVTTYDPIEDQWVQGAELIHRRTLHTATALPDGAILVVGSQSDDSQESRLPEIYRPGTSSWQETGVMRLGRANHTTTVLADGRVLVAGGQPVTGDEPPALGTEGDESDPCFFYDEESATQCVEIYDPRSGNWTTAAPLRVGRFGHRALLTPDGKILFAGGFTPNSGKDTELYDPYAGIDESSRPVITSVDPVIRYDGVAPEIRGTGFRGIGEGSSGTTFQSASDFPLVTFRHLESDHLVFVPVDDFLATKNGESVLRLGRLPALMPGRHWVTVIVNGAPSRPFGVDVECGLFLDEPVPDVRVDAGTPATFTVRVQGARTYQWFRDGEPIPGADGPSYTTPPVQLLESGTRYSVRIRSGCSELFSEATLTVNDLEPPEVVLENPSGGEIWLLSQSGQAAQERTVSWTMSDNVRICSVFAELLYSNDGNSWQPAPHFPLMESPVTEEDCRGDGLDLTSLTYPVPATPPSGQFGSLYQVRVRVTDHAGLTAVSPQTDPFYIVRPDNADVRTVILWSSERMREVMSAQRDDLDAELEALRSHLEQLADHPKVAGWVVDLGEVADLQSAYAQWAADPSPQNANELLFGCLGGPPCYSVQEHLGQILTALPNAEYLLIVGDDRIIPMTRLIDRTALPESHYVKDPSVEQQDPDGITPESSVARALLEDFYLSDDPLARRSTAVGDLNRLPLLTDLMPGRLVETPPEMVRAISRFLSLDGTVDFQTFEPGTDHVLVTGYDFLVDGARVVEQRWRAFNSDLPENHDLISPDWGIDPVPGDADLTARRTALADAMNRSAGVLQVLGHATHSHEGVPGDSALDIQGLSADRLYDPADPFLPACSPVSPPEVDTSSSVVLALGCHGGLSVPGSCVGDEDRSLDLAQAYLGSGALAYVSNTGYGWGLTRGVGLAEPLQVLAAEQLTAAPSPSIGEVVRDSKRRYYLQSAPIDAYDEKTGMQWTLFGFPMTTISVGAAPPNLGAGPAVQTRVKSSPVRVSGADPSLSILSQTLTFGDATFRKFDADGFELSDTPGCPHEDGCYYTLNGLADSTDEPDLPIQPFFMQPDTRLSGTSQHGILWLGATYTQENDWQPLFAEPVSNLPITVEGELDPLPRTLFIRPVGNVQGGRPTAAGLCAAEDLEPNSLVYITGETVRHEPRPDSDIAEPTWSQRLHREVDLEIFYFNDQQNPAANCDRTGPEILDVDWTRDGELVSWSVEAVDDGDALEVWRVVMVCTDGLTDTSGSNGDIGSWTPTELEPSSVDRWRADQIVAADAELTCFAQAVDRRGNVSWLLADIENTPSGVAPGLPKPIVVSPTTIAANLRVELRVEPNPAAVDDLVWISVEASHLEGDLVNQAQLQVTLPTDLDLLLVDDGIWSCSQLENDLSCELTEPLVSSQPPQMYPVGLLVRARVPGDHALSAELSFPGETQPEDNFAIEELSVVGPTFTDVEVIKTVDHIVMDPKQPLVYTIRVINHGPNPIFNAEVHDLFSPLVLEVYWSCSASAGASCTPEGTGHIHDPVDLDVGSEVIYTVMAVVDADILDPLPNTAWVDLPPGMSDWDPQNNLSRVISYPAAGLLFVDGFEQGNCTTWTRCHDDQ